MNIIKNILLIYIPFNFILNISFAQTSNKNKLSDTVKTKERIGVVSSDNKLERTNKSDELKGGAKVYEVEEIYVEGTDKKEGGLGNYIIVKVKFLPDLILEQTNKNKKIIPYINGLPLKGTYPIILKDSASIDYGLKFFLQRNDSSVESWNAILREPVMLPHSIRNVSLSVGLENERPIKSAEKNFDLLIIGKGSFYLFCITMIILLILTLYLAKKTALLKEPVIINDPTIKRCYSLALSQMAFWSYLIIAAFIGLFIITKEFPSITGSVLTLIGISSATALGGTLINYNKITESKIRDRNITAEKKMLTDRIEEINKLLNQNPLPINSTELQKERDIKQTRLFETIQTNPVSINRGDYSSKGFFRDILSDSGGISLYRFQIAVWTLILGAIFIYNVWSNLSMPQFDNTLLALMGISSGTYLGFKIPEQK